MHDHALVNGAGKDLEEHVLDVRRVGTGAARLPFLLVVVARECCYSLEPYEIYTTYFCVM